MANIRLQLAYEGTRYLGWQKTRMGPSIEETVETALTRIFHRPFALQAASRTDAGVHAEGQVVNFFLPAEKSSAVLMRSLNALLPSDIAVEQLEVAEEQFHPTLDATAKEYHYHVCNSQVQLPFHRHFSWHFPYPVARDAMQEAAALLLGEHDFSAFSNQRTGNGVCHISSIALLPLADQRLRIAIRGNRFLYRMVRNLAGTLLYIGCGKLSPSALPGILEGRERSAAGVTAPAHGLTLHRVFYD